MYKNLCISVVIPAQDEEQAIGLVINDLKDIRNTDFTMVVDQIVVCDNGSVDRTAMKAIASGAKVVKQAKPGYGIACQTAIRALDACDVVLFVDGDYSCDISQSLALLEGIYSGDDIAIGSRVLGTQERGSLTVPQRFGNWLAARLIKVFWSYELTDLGPFRAIRKKALEQLDMKDESFGWTVEMQVKSIVHSMRMTEYPVDSRVRVGQSKISGTVVGSVKAGIGILSMIFKLRFGLQGLFPSSQKQKHEPI